MQRSDGRDCQGPAYPSHSLCRSACCLSPSYAVCLTFVKSLNVAYCDADQSRLPPTPQRVMLRKHWLVCLVLRPWLHPLVRIVPVCRQPPMACPQWPQRMVALWTSWRRCTTAYWWTPPAAQMWQTAWSSESTYCFGRSCCSRADSCLKSAQAGRLKHHAGQLIQHKGCPGRASIAWCPQSFYLPAIRQQD